MPQGKANKVHLHNYSCDGKIIQAILKQNGDWSGEVDGKDSTTLFLHLYFFQKNKGLPPLGYIERGSKYEDQLFRYAKGKYKHLRGYKHLGEAFVDNDLRFGTPSAPETWLVPEEDKAKIVKVIEELEARFDFPDIEIRNKNIKFTSEGKVIFEPYMSIHWWLQKDGTITKDYPLSIHHRLNSVFTAAGFKVLEASPKAVRIESTSRFDVAAAVNAKGMKRIGKTDYYLVNNQRNTANRRNETLKKYLPEGHRPYVGKISIHFRRVTNGISLYVEPNDISIDNQSHFVVKFSVVGQWYNIKTKALSNSMPTEVEEYLAGKLSKLSDLFGKWMQPDKRNLVLRSKGQHEYAELMPRDPEKVMELMPHYKKLIELSDEAGGYTAELMKVVDDMKQLMADIAGTMEETKRAAGGPLEYVEDFVRDEIESRQEYKTTKEKYRDYKARRNKGMKPKDAMRIITVNRTLGVLNRGLVYLDIGIKLFSLVKGLAKHSEYLKRRDKLFKAKKKIDGKLVPKQKKIKDKIEYIKEKGAKLPKE